MDDDDDDEDGLDEAEVEIVEVDVDDDDCLSSGWMPPWPCPGPVLLLVDVELTGVVAIEGYTVPADGHVEDTDGATKLEPKRS